MIAARIARHLARKPAQRRGPVAFLLLHRIEWTDEHPGAVLAGIAIVGLVFGVIKETWL